MIRITAKLDPVGKAKVFKALNATKKKLVVLTNQVPKRIAERFSVEFKKAIIQDTYKESVPELSAKHIKTKLRRNQNPNPWKMELNLLSAIGAWKEKGVWRAGVPKGLPGSNDQYIGYYAHKAEYGSLITEDGGQRQPGRPYMRFTFNDFMAGKKYKKDIDDAKAEIISAWSK